MIHDLKALQLFPIRLCDEIKKYQATKTDQFILMHWVYLIII